MSFMIQSHYYNERNTTLTSNKVQTQTSHKAVSERVATTQTSKIENTEPLSPEEEMAAFKQSFYEELSKINPHRTVDNMAVNISEDAFKQMKNDPEYKEQILNLIKRDWGNSYAPRNTSVLIHVGSTLNDYRADSWPVIADDGFHMGSQGSFYKKTSSDKTETTKERFEDYLQKRQEAKRIEKRLLDKKANAEEAMREALQQSGVPDSLTFL